MPRKLMQSLGFARRGIIYVWRSQRNVKIHFVVGILAIILGVVLKISWSEMVILVLVISMVIITEMINTALEEIVNLMILIRKVRAKVAKDVAASSVLVAALASLVVGGMIFIPHIIDLVLGR